ncbi:MAG: hypothetical protein EA363_09520 [Balneolaceae bacterium]|nr:MAG: hypothetical protein EA363_09520 [Balneolaceae bacterium]
MEDDKTGTAAKIEKNAESYDGGYRDIIEKLHEEKERLENDLRQEYRNARKYVRSHPEEGLAYAFLGGVLAGVILAKMLSR